ncbi:thioesterase II family protein [Xenorhabdus sp. IM139775]|uniref:thioesterase II family protein n=1 Tax=Xenorhabdus sp. IM139775 TaxID=3025876 RepID=UPI002359BD73|nr:thioesterase domain-containing protein [Xenorhabdus sp. IM139775]MDC9594928.1 thioesterase domain-containing protein [Xenorhabdus sp. IM139775]
MMQKKKWISHFGDVKKARLRIICFPFGGGGASSYRLWHEIFGSEVEICPVHLPGRESRYGEEPCLDADVLVNDLLPELLPLLNCPSIFFGYSLGAALAYKTVVECSKIVRDNKILSLICCARTSPNKKIDNEYFTHLSQEEFIEYIITLGGISRSTFNDPELRTMALKLLRSDFMLSSSIIEPKDQMVNTPIYAIGGDTDPSVSINELQGWKRCTSGEFKSFILPGGHFFMNEHPVKFHELLNDIVSFEKGRLN